MFFICAQVHICWAIPYNTGFSLQRPMFALRSVHVGFVDSGTGTDFSVSPSVFPSLSFHHCSIFTHIVGEMDGIMDIRVENVRDALKCIYFTYLSLWAVILMLIEHNAMFRFSDADIVTFQISCLVSWWSYFLIHCKGFYT
jgi:hypothetical protein